MLIGLVVRRFTMLATVAAGTTVVVALLLLMLMLLMLLPVLVTLGVLGAMISPTFLQGSDLVPPPFEPMWPLPVQ
jgi:hypothetical protein